jgi:hypothetical protein
VGPQRKHHRSGGLKEWIREFERRRWRGDGTHGHGTKPTREVTRPQGLGPLAVDAYSAETERPDDMPQEVGAAARGLDQGHVPVRPRELDN